MASTSSTLSIHHPIVSHRPYGVLQPVCRGRTVARAGFHLSELSQQRVVQQVLPTSGLGKPPALSNNSSAQTSSPIAPILVGLLAVAGLSGIAFNRLKTTRWYKNLSVQWGFKDDFLYKEAMRETESGSLSKDIIMAARNRRSKDGLSANVTITELELPQNHPWATNKPVPKDEADAQMQRLRLRSTRRRGQMPTDDK